MLHLMSILSVIYQTHQLPVMFLALSLGHMSEVCSIFDERIDVESGLIGALLCFQ